MTESEKELIELVKIMTKQFSEISLRIEVKPNFSDDDFMYATQVFMWILTDKMYDLQTEQNMDINDRILMSDSAGKELKKLIHTFTGIDTVGYFKTI